MGSGGVAIADPPIVMRLKVPFSDGLGGGCSFGRYKQEPRTQKITLRMLMISGLMVLFMDQWG